jgi:hypothetical protein
MNCPKCGLPALSDQKFCRSCGAGMMTTQPLTNQALVSDLETAPAVLSKDGTQRASGLVLWAFIIMFIGVAIGVIGKKLMHDEIVTVVGVLLSLAGMFLTAYPYLSPPRQKRSDSSPASKAEVLPQSQPTTYLPQGSSTEYIPSITERTTHQLKNPPETIPRRDKGGE